MLCLGFKGLGDNIFGICLEGQNKDHSALVIWGVYIEVPLSGETTIEGFHLEAWGLEAKVKGLKVKGFEVAPLWLRGVHLGSRFEVLKIDGQFGVQGLGLELEVVRIWGAGAFGV